MWAVDLLGLALMVGAWMAVPRWASITSAFYARRGLDLGDGRPFVFVLRLACVAVSVFAIADLIRRLA